MISRKFQLFIQRERFELEKKLPRGEYLSIISAGGEIKGGPLNDNHRIILPPETYYAYS